MIFLLLKPGRKNLEEMRKMKELNSAFNNKSLYQNIQDITMVKQKLNQSRTELQRNFNETSKLKEQITSVSGKS
jgi:hypothetical protein